MEALGAALLYAPRQMASLDTEEKRAVCAVCEFVVCLLPCMDFASFEYLDNGQHDLACTACSMAQLARLPWLCCCCGSAMSG